MFGFSEERSQNDNDVSWVHGFNHGGRVSITWMAEARSPLSHLQQFLTKK
jgi:hypothetical protein